MLVRRGDSSSTTKLGGRGRRRTLPRNYGKEMCVENKTTTLEQYYYVCA